MEFLLSVFELSSIHEDIENLQAISFTRNQSVELVRAQLMLNRVTNWVKFSHILDRPLRFNWVFIWGRVGNFFSFFFLFFLYFQSVKTVKTAYKGVVCLLRSNRMTQASECDCPVSFLRVIFVFSLKPFFFVYFFLNYYVELFISLLHFLSRLVRGIFTI